MTYGKIVIKQRATTGDAVNENLGVTNIDAMDADNQIVIAQLIAGMNAIAALTTNTLISNNVSYDVELPQA